MITSYLEKKHQKTLGGDFRRLTMSAHQWSEVVIPTLFDAIKVVMDLQTTIAEVWRQLQLQTSTCSAPPGSARRALLWLPRTALRWV